MEKFAPDEKKEMARAMGRALGHRGGADSSVVSDPCQDPFARPARMSSPFSASIADIPRPDPLSRRHLAPRCSAWLGGSIGILPVRS